MCCLKMINNQERTVSQGAGLPWPARDDPNLSISCAVLFVLSLQDCPGQAAPLQGSGDPATRGNVSCAVSEPREQ